LGGGRTRLELSTDVPGLILRRLSDDDAKVYYDLIDRNRDHLTAHGDYQEMRHATLQSILDGLAGPPEDNIAFGVLFGDALIGRVDLVPREAGNFVLGYWLDQEHTGHGYATVACTTLIEFGRSALQATDIWAGVTKGNVASESVLERLGFERVGDMGSYIRFHRSLRA
jgi:ribosomal-protein-serine acetyltransferase